MRNTMLPRALRLTGALMGAVLCLAAAGCGRAQEDPPTTLSNYTEEATTLSPSEVKEAVSEHLGETTAAQTTAAVTETAAPADPAETAAPADPAATAAPADPAAADPNVPAETAAPADPGAVPQPDTGPQPGDVMPAVGASGQLADKVWLAHSDEGTDRYLTFYDDTNGSYRDQETGDGASFTYSLSGSTAVFHIDGADHTVEVTWADNGTGYLLWDGTQGETIRQIRGSAAEPLDFFSNEQLREMALNYYQSHNGYRPAAAETLINYDGKIAIHLFDDMGDHIATSDRYTVDRYTAVGTNFLGETIDLKAP